MIQPSTADLSARSVLKIFSGFDVVSALACEMFPPLKDFASFSFISHEGETAFPDLDAPVVEAFFRAGVVVSFKAFISFQSLSFSLTLSQSGKIE